MSNDEADMVSKHLRRLADHAPTIDPLRMAVPPTRPRVRRRGVLVASVGAVLLFSVLILTLKSGLGTTADREIAADRGSSSMATGHPPVVPTVSSGGTMELSKVAGWPRIEVGSCSDWLPGSGDTVVVTGVLDARCIEAAPRDATTVFLSGYLSEAPFGGSWEAQTDEWRQIDGHDLRRLVRGPMAEMSSRYVDAVTCRTCDQVAVVVGPSPTAVRAIVESVQG